MEPGEGQKAIRRHVPKIRRDSRTPSWWIWVKGSVPMRSTCTLSACLAVVVLNCWHAEAALAQSEDATANCIKRVMLRAFDPAQTFEITRESAPSVNFVELRALRSIDVVQLDPDALKYDEVRSALADSKALFVTKTDRSIDELSELFEEKNIESIHTLVLLSSEPDAVRNIFGPKARANTQSRIESALETFKQVPGVRFASEGSDTSSVANDTLQTLKTAKKGEFFLIVGHNEGGVVVCPDKSRLRIDAIQAAIASSDGNGPKRRRSASGRLQRTSHDSKVVHAQRSVAHNGG